MAQRATSLGPKPSLFYLFLFFYVFFCFVGFLVFASARRNPFPPQKKGHFCVFFLSLPLFLFSLVSLSPFSVSLSFFVSLLFFSCFLPCCFSFLFLVLAFPFCFVCFLLLSCSLVSVVLLVVLLCFES